MSNRPTMQVAQSSESAVSRVSKPATALACAKLPIWKRRRPEVCKPTLAAAFTLIELLVVIAIIGILAALIVPLSGVATAKMRMARVSTELNQYVTAIENYKLETGSYPPDNGDLRSVAAIPIAYKTNAAYSTLYYELTGTVFTNGTYRTLATGDAVSPTAINAVFHVSGIQNAARNKHDLAYKGFSIRAGQHAALNVSGSTVEILNVPVPGPYEIAGKNNKRINPWFYDSSTTNRHNRSGFDLWAEIIVGNKQTNIIGNWKN
jgi:prepilin-type N-terminal cleavage/methylation domain-containing protein